MPSVIEIAQSLVRIPSVNPYYDQGSAAETAVVQWIENWARQHSIDFAIQEVLPGRNNILLAFENGAQQPHFLMAGHTDTVATEGMVAPLFSGKISDGRLFGRGSADMKGPLAAMLSALLLLRDRREQWHGTVTVACVVDEEYHAEGIKALLARGDRRYDFAVVGEPTRLRVVRGCKGCLRFSFEAIGASAHSSTPELGKNAIVAMSRAILALNEYCETALGQESRPKFGSSTGSIGLITGGSGINIVPESCRASVDIRLIPGQRWERIFAEARACIEKSQPPASGIKWKFDDTPFADPAFETAESDALVRTSLALRAQDEADIVAYSCDASKIGAAGVSCIIMGPGDIAEAHTSNESIGLEEIEAAVRCYADLAQRLMPIGGMAAFTSVNEEGIA